MWSNRERKDEESPWRHRQKPSVSDQNREGFDRKFDRKYLWMKGSSDGDQRISLATRRTVLGTREKKHTQERRAPILQWK